MEVEPEIDALTQPNDLIEDSFSSSPEKEIHHHGDDGELNHHQVLEPVQPELHLENEEVPNEHRSCCLHLEFLVRFFSPPPTSTRYTKEEERLIQWRKRPDGTIIVQIPFLGTTALTALPFYGYEDE
jgi:hypothetical protein